MALPPPTIKQHTHTPVTPCTSDSECKLSHCAKTTDISVLVAVHNVEKYLTHCLESLTNQTLLTAEFIVVDDGSTDSSSLICDSYAKKDSRFKIIHQKNQGTLVARKTAINNASGRFCLFLDGDDYLSSPRTLEQLLKIAAKESVDILQFSIEIDVRESCNQECEKNFFNWFGPKPLSQVIYSSHQILRACFIEENFRWTLWGKIFDSSVLKKAIKYTVDEFFVCAEDIYLFFLAAYFSSTFKSIQTEPFYTYRFGSGISTIDISIRQFELYSKEVLLINWLKVFLISEKQLEKYQLILEQIAKNLFNTLLYRFEALPTQSRAEAWDLILRYTSPQSILPYLFAHFKGREDELSDSLLHSSSLICSKSKTKVIGIFYHRFYEGGVERSISRQIYLLKSMGFDVVLFLESRAPQREYPAPDGVNKVVIPQSYSDDRAAVFARGLKQYKVDVVIHHASSSENLLYDLVLIKSSGIPVVTVRNELTMCGMLWQDPALLKRIRSLRLTDRLIVLSKMEEFFYRSLGIHTTYIPNITDYLKKQKKPSNHHGKVVLWVGRLDWIKNYHEALEIMAGVVHKDESITCIMVGGEYTPGAAKEVVDFIEKKQLKASVRWVGSATDMKQYYNQADVLLVTSMAESFSMTIAEGMAHGIPIVSYELPYLELIKNNFGVLSVKQHDVSGAINAILEIITSENLYKQYAEGSYKSFQQFTQFDCEAAWQEVFNETIHPKFNKFSDSNSAAWEFLESTLFFHQEILKNRPALIKEKNVLTESQRIQLYRYGVVLRFIHRYLPENSLRKKIVKSLFKPLFSLIK